MEKGAVHATLGQALINKFHTTDMDEPSEEEMDVAFKLERIAGHVYRPWQNTKDNAAGTEIREEIGSPDSQQYNECPSHIYRNDHQSWKLGIDGEENDD